MCGWFKQMGVRCRWRSCFHGKFEAGVAECRLCISGRLV